MPDRDTSYLSGGGNVSGSGGMGGGGALGNGNGCGNGGAGASGAAAGLAVDGVCRDFVRNVCKRGKRCRFRHPDFNEVSDLGVQKNEFIFCHDHQNKECMRSSCRFVHGSKDDEDYYKKSGELPLRLRGKVAARLGLSPMDLPHSRGEVPICRDFLKGECQRGNKCKFRHVKKDYEYEPAPRAGVGGAIGAGSVGMVNAGGPRRYERGACSVYDPLFESGFFEPGPLEAPVDHTTLHLKRRRLEGLRLVDGTGGGHFELGVQAALPPRPLEYRFLEEENALLRKRVEELKKQVSNLLATNDVLLEQNAQYRSQAKVITLTSTPLPTEQSLVPTVASSYNHSIAQTHTTLSSAGLQSRAVTQQDLVASSGAPTAPPANTAPPTAPPPHLNPEIAPLSAALVQTIAQGMGPPVSMASVAVSVAPVAVSLAQPLAGITMSHATTPMVSYPIASQSMRITTLPH
ncbi:unnamed protein product [Lota lota]